MQGPLYRLLFVIGTLIGVSFLGGLLAMMTGEFASLNEAVWWAFLRLSDPGYLGDDHGLVLRTISTFLTVAGYVLFLGALIAIMTQWLNQALRRLESGLTPIADRDHLVVLGWTSKTATLVRELLISGPRQTRSGWWHRRSENPRVTVLAEDVDAELQQELRERVGPEFRPEFVILRSGTPLRLEHLRRVAAAEAKAIMLPAPDSVQPGIAPDTETIKSLLTLASLHDEEEDSSLELPLVVAELLDGRKAVTARRAYPGRLHLIASNRVISSLICQNIRHPGLSEVYGTILTHGEGSELYARQFQRFAGMRFGDLTEAFPQAVLIGVVRQVQGHNRALLNPSDDLVIEQNDRFVLIAEDNDATEPVDDYQAARGDYGQGVPSAPELMDHRRILILGWNHRVADIVAELDSYQNERFSLVFASMIPVTTRLRQLDDHDVEIHRLDVQHVEIDYTVPGKLRRLSPGDFDNVLFLANDWIEFEQSDARTILGHLLLHEILADVVHGPSVLVELVDPGNLPLVQRTGTEVIIPPQLLSHIMTQVARHGELQVVFDDLFGPEGSEIFFRPIESYALCDKDCDFDAIRRSAAVHNETAIGVRTNAGELFLNPRRAQRWQLRAGDELVVLATYAC